MWSEQSEKLEWDLGQARKELDSSLSHVLLCLNWIKLPFPWPQTYQSLEVQTSCFHQHRKLQRLEYKGRGSDTGVWDTIHLTACNKLKKQKLETTSKSWTEHKWFRIDFSLWNFDYSCSKGLRTLSKGSSWPQKAWPESDPYIPKPEADISRVRRRKKHHKTRQRHSRFSLCHRQMKDWLMCLLFW